MTSTFQAFHEAVELAVEYKKDPKDIEDQIMEELENMWTMKTAWENTSFPSHLLYLHITLIRFMWMILEWNGGNVNEWLAVALPRQI